MADSNSGVGEPQSECAGDDQPKTGQPGIAIGLIGGWWRIRARGVDRAGEDVGLVASDVSQGSVLRVLDAGWWTLQPVASAGSRVPASLFHATRNSSSCFTE
jgi:hypothetical protein